MPALVDTTIRLLGQEPLAGVMPIAEQLRLAEILDSAGFAYLEVSGGGCFDSAVKRGVESPWERIRALRARTKTPLALALRGRFLVGSRPVGPDFVRRFVESAAENGIDVFRMHDPLNDVSNLREASEAITAAERELDAGLVYSPGPSGETDALVTQARRLPELGAARVLIHDPSGSLDPNRVRELVEGVREASGLPVGLYCQGAGGSALAAAPARPAPAQPAPGLRAQRAAAAAAPPAASVVPRMAMDGHGHAALEYYRGISVSKWIIASGSGPIKQESSTDRFTEDFCKPLVPDKPLRDSVLSFIRTLHFGYLKDEGVAAILIATYRTVHFGAVAPPKDKETIENWLSYCRGLATAMKAPTPLSFKNLAAANAYAQELEAALAEPTKAQAAHLVEERAAATKRLAGLADLKLRSQENAAAVARRKPSAGAMQTRVERARAANAARANGHVAKPRGQGIGSFCCGLILEGKTNEQVLKAALAQFPGASTSQSSVAWYRNDLRRKGQLAK